MLKKALSLGVAIVVFLSMFSFHPGTAKAAGIVTYRGGLFVWGKGVVFVFEGSGFRNKDVKGADIFAGSNFHDLYCNVNKDEDEKIVCVAGGRLAEYAGEAGVIHLAGQVFYVTIPAKPSTSKLAVGEAGGTGGDGSVCSVLGANVRFDDVDGDSSTEFVRGNTMAEVIASANATLASDADLVGYGIVSDIYCRAG
jgi:hypothetical protein